MKNLSDYIEKNQTGLFKRKGAFFAFSDKQFDEKKQEGVVYKNISGLGLVCPAENCKSLMDEHSEIVKEGINQDIEENGIDRIIRRELNNYEAFYTYDFEDTIEALKPYKITLEQIVKVFNENIAEVEAQY